MAKLAARAMAPSVLLLHRCHERKWQVACIPQEYLVVYFQRLVGGKGGTRTLDPGIMRAGVNGFAFAFVRDRDRNPLKYLREAIS